MKKNINRFIFIMLLSFLALGFRLGWKNTMSSSKSSPKIYIEICDSIKTETFGENSVGSSDELHNNTGLDTVDLIYSIAKDYNSIGGSYLDVVVKGDTDEDGDIDGTDDSSHGAIAEDKIIEFCTGGTGGLLAGGVAETKEDGGCTIKIGDATFDDVKSFLRIVTHEIGHCLGLDHSHAMNDLSIMSYFASEEIYRLQMDDKLGILHLYPSEKLKESSTFGLSCDGR
ncbi:MAG: matrixin family metalloprotease [Bacteriovoracaceae bacterium]|nr:matrixin family metalloprotease [Bacteriovoracaceae bacterium]